MGGGGGGRNARSYHTYYRISNHASPFLSPPYPPPTPPPPPALAFALTVFYLSCQVWAVPVFLPASFAVALEWKPVFLAVAAHSVSCCLHPSGSSSIPYTRLALCPSSAICCNGPASLSGVAGSSVSSLFGFQLCQSLPSVCCTVPYN